MAASDFLFAEGSFKGTGASVEVGGDKVGFRPRYVKLVNVTQHSTAEWFSSMADDSAEKTVAAGTQTTITSDGITPGDLGFDLGADADLNAADDDIKYVCFG